MTTTTVARFGWVRRSAALSSVALILASCSSTSSVGTSSVGTSSVGTSSVGTSSVGTSSVSTGVSAGSDPEAKGMTIHFVNPLPTYPTWKQTGACMKSEADKRGAVFTQSGPTGAALDTTVMIQQIQQAKANKIDAIVTFPASDSFAQVLKQAQAAGVVTGTFYGPGGADSGADVNAAPDWGKIGSQMVGAVAALPGKHVLGLAAQDNTGIGKAWTAGVTEAAAKTSNVTIAGEVYTNDDAAKALPQVTALLTAHPDVNEVMSHMGTVNLGAGAAIKALGREGKTFLMVGGHDNGGTEALNKGTANLMLMTNPCALGKAMVDGVIAVHNGKPAPEVPVSIAVIGKDQLQAHLSDGWV